MATYIVKTSGAIFGANGALAAGETITLAGDPPDGWKPHLDLVSADPAEGATPATGEGGKTGGPGRPTKAALAERIRALGGNPDESKKWDDLAADLAALEAAKKQSA